MKMKNIWKASAILVFAAVGIFAVSASKTMVAAAEYNNLSAEENSAQSARALYLRNCARCHGADGKSQTKAGIDSDAPDLTQFKPSVSKSIRAITNGADGMPAFGSKLKKSQISALANYVRKL